MQEIPTNSGVVEVLPGPDDWKAGGETGVLDTVRLPSADWKPFLPTNEKQLITATTPQYGLQVYADSNACVTFSAMNNLELQLDLLISENLLPADNLKFLKDFGYIDENGHVNFSDRFTAKMSGTNPHVGNSLPNVWQSVRRDGLIPEKVWSMQECSDELALLVESGKPFTQEDVWSIYYKQPSQAAIDLGIEFTKHFTAQWEWVVFPGSGVTMSAYTKILQVAPLHIATAVCKGWNTDNPIGACGAGTAHATTMVAVEPGVAYDIYDHYNPFLKRFAADYTITYGMRGVIIPISQAPVPPPTFKYTFTKQLTYNSTTNDSAELKALQTALQFLKSPTSGKPYMQSGVFGPFGPKTRTALALFESDNHIVDPQPGENFGPKNRATMNALLNK